MKKTNKLIGLFASSAVVVPLAGCSDAPNDVDICYDLDYNQRCDDNDDYVSSQDYLVIDGKKTRIFITDDSFVKGEFGDDDDSSFGG